MIRKISRYKVIERDRFVVETPVDSELFVQRNQSVKKGEPLFKEQISEIVETYYLPKALGVKAVQASDYIGRVSGQHIQKGDLLAERLTGAGLMTKRVVAGVDGIVSTKRIKSGYIDILAEAQEKVVLSPVDGLVTEIRLGKFIEIESKSIAVEYFAAHHLDKSAHHVDTLSKEHVVSGALISIVKPLKSDDIKQKNIFGGLLVKEVNSKVTKGDAQNSSTSASDTQTGSVQSMYELMSYPKSMADEGSDNTMLSQVSSMKSSRELSAKQALYGSLVGGGDGQRYTSNSEGRVVNAREMSLLVDSEKADFSGKIVYVGNYLQPEILKELYKRQAVAVIGNAMDYSEFKSIGIPVILLNGFGLQSGKENFALETLLNAIADLDEGEIFIEMDIESRQLHIFGLSEKQIKLFMKGAPGGKLDITLDDDMLDEHGINPDIVGDFYGLTADVKIGDYVRSIDPMRFGISGRVVDVQEFVTDSYKSSTQDPEDKANSQILIVQRDSGAQFIIDTSAVEIVV